MDSVEKKFHCFKFEKIETMSEHFEKCCFCDGYAELSTKEDINFISCVKPLENINEILFSLFEKEFKTRGYSLVAFKSMHIAFNALNNLIEIEFKAILK